jgi:hypothetical protein
MVGGARLGTVTRYEQRLEVTCRVPTKRRLTTSPWKRDRGSARAYGGNDQTTDLGLEDRRHDKHGRWCSHDGYRTTSGTRDGSRGCESSRSRHVLRLEEPVRTEKIRRTRQFENRNARGERERLTKQNKSPGLITSEGILVGLTMREQRQGRELEDEVDNEQNQRENGDSLLSDQFGKL